MQKFEKYVFVERPFRQFKAYNEAALNSHKTMGGPKPKGLSMRSSSDINVSHNTAPTNVKKNDSAQDFLKIKITQMDNKGYPISPGKEISTNVIKKIYYQTLLYTIFFLAL